MLCGVCHHFPPQPAEAGGDVEEEEEAIPRTRTFSFRRRKPPAPATTKVSKRGGGREGGGVGEKCREGRRCTLVSHYHTYTHTHTHNTHTHRQTLFFYPSNLLPPISLSHCSPRRRSNSRLNSQSVSTMSSQSTLKASMTGENMVCIYSVQCIYI